MVTKVCSPFCSVPKITYLGLSPWTKQEFDGADHLKKKIIPIMLDPLKRVPESVFVQLTSIQWIDFTDSNQFNKKLEELIEQSKPFLKSTE